MTLRRERPAGRDFRPSCGARALVAGLLLVLALVVPRVAAADGPPAAAPPPKDSLAARLFGPTGQPPDAGPTVEPAPYPWLWRIEGDRPSYLFGTVHVADPRVTALHPAVLKAIADTDGVYTELEFSAQLQLEAMEKTQLPPGVTLDQVLKPEIYARLKRFLREKGIGIKALNRMKIWVVIMMVEIGDLRELMSKGIVLDMKLAGLAIEMGKETGGVETLDEQLGVFDSFTHDEQGELLTMTLDEAEKDEDNIEKLLLAYLSGDEAGAQKVIEDYDEEKAGELGKRLMHALIDERNVRMADRIEVRLRERHGKNGFYAFGLGHFTGEKGVVALLRAKGYTVTRVVPPPAHAEAEAVESDAAESTSSMR